MPRRSDPYERLLRRARRDSRTECLLVGERRDRYAQVEVISSGGDRLTLAGQRVAWEAHNGPLSRDVVVRHRCDTPACIEITHLEPGTQAQNVLDMQERGRGRRPDLDRHICRYGHDMTELGVRKKRTKIGSLAYTCAECDRIQQRQRRATKEKVDA